VYTNKLACASYLSFTDERIEAITQGKLDPMHQFRLMMRNVHKYHSGKFPYVVVPEFSATKRLHLHLMLPANFNFDLIEDRWSKHGIAQHCQITSELDLIRMGFYLGKDFDEPVGKRPFERRMTTAPSFKPKPKNYGLLTAAEVEQLVIKMANNVGTEITEFDSTTPWLRGGFTWFDTRTTEPGGYTPVGKLKI